MQPSQLLKEGAGAEEDPSLQVEEEKDEEEEDKKKIDFAHGCGRFSSHVCIVYHLYPKLRKYKFISGYHLVSTLALLLRGGALIVP